MLQRVKAEGLELPRLYVAETMADVAIAKEHGIPYVRWRHGMDALLKQLLRPAIEKLFPGIKWDKVLGKRTPFKSKVIIVPGGDNKCQVEIADYDAQAMLEKQYEHDEVVDDISYEGRSYQHSRDVPIASSSRDCVGSSFADSSNDFIADELPIEDYVGDLSASVNIEVLQKLHMLPAFLGDITDCVKLNLSQSMRWTEGYTKKLGYPLGKFNAKYPLPNLVIIAVSYSIPDGIAATMLTLADTLRSQCNAELIITSRRSGYYPIGAELPKPQTLRDYYGRSNESAEFMAILKKHIAGREFGHVISFGDNDNPGMLWQHSVNMAGTKVHEVHHYHTSYYSQTGYARWVDECCANVVEHIDTSWCSIMDKDYTL